MSGRKLARRACDGCKIRKIKCSETTPCEGCKNANISCTWLKQAQPRGPRRLRDATLQEICKAQDILQSQSREATRRALSRSANVNDPDPPPQPSSEIGQLVLYLCVYRVQLYPVWPIIKIERLIASLQSDSPDVEVFALAYALAAATATRTKNTDLSISHRNHAQILEEKCQTARARVPPGRPPNLTTVRIAFFLHIYYESLEANSMKSMLYLREAVTIATMIGLHKESYYSEVPPQEQEIRRRVLWMLFITERVISVLYQQPITLRTKIELPSTSDTDEIDTLAGFRLLVRLVWKLDEACFFQILDELDTGTSPSSNGPTSPAKIDVDFASLIRIDVAPRQYIPPVQALGLVVTQCWFHVVNIRIQHNTSLDLVSIAESKLTTLFSAARDVAAVLRKSSRHVVEAHGIALQLKVGTITGALHELLSSDSASWNGHFESFQICSQVVGSIELALMEKTEQNVNSTASTPLSIVGDSVSKITKPSQTKREGSQISDRRKSRSPDYQQMLVPSLMRSSPTSPTPAYLQQDFAMTNNYEGLFNAVQLAGVESSDAVEDLFSHASLSSYNTFDDTWLSSDMHDRNTRALPNWQRQPYSAFDQE